MTRGKLLALALLACLVISTGILSAGTTTSSISVGDFAVMIASRVNPEAAAKGLTPVSASELLKKSGIKVKSNLDSDLTESDAADIFSQFGITLQSLRPMNTLDRTKASALVSTFGDTLAARTQTTVKVSAPTKNTSGTVISTEAIQDCQALPKTKDCHDCCNALGYANKVCGQACSGGPKASGVEPTP
jgi:hypothetical protein